MDRRQTLPGQFAQPRKERAGRPRQILSEPPLRFGEHLFEHLGRADNAVQPRVEAKPHHLPQPALVPPEQLKHGAVSLRTHQSQQSIGLAGIGDQGHCAPIPGLI